jgi:GDP-L-fucose synthase
MIPFELAGKRIWVAGHQGMVGAATVRRLASENCTLLAVGRAELDLMDQAAVRSWMRAKRPDVVIVAAAKVGGILANSTMPVDFLYNNLMISTNIINSAWENGVSKLLYLGSSCIYPRNAEQPMREEALLTGALEPTNQWYALAKISGLMLCQAYREQHGCDFISAMPTNLYGPHDNFDLLSSHVLPALLVKNHLAKLSSSPEVMVWGTGAPLREFLHVDDLADALVYLLTHYSGASHVNIGSGDELTIRELAVKIQDVVDYKGKILFDSGKPDGAPRKLLDSSLIRSMGWKPRISLEEGLRQTYGWYLSNQA